MSENKIEVDTQMLLDLSKIAKKNGKVNEWADLAIDWLEQYLVYENESNEKLRNEALKNCIEVYEQYKRDEVGEFHGCITRCWKVGKRASKDKSSL